MSDEDKSILKNDEQDEQVEGHMLRLRNEEGADEMVRTDSDEEPDVEGHRVVPRTHL